MRCLRPAALARYRAVCFTVVLGGVLTSCGGGQAAAPTVAATPAVAAPSPSAAAPTGLPSTPPSPPPPGATSGADTTPATSATGALLTSAQSQLDALRQSDYQHTTKVDAAAGRFDYDCSGFVDYTLGQVAPAALAEIPASTSAGRPLAQDFEAYFSRLGAGDSHWTRVPTVTQIRPGDVVSWLVSPDVQSRDTGHVMIAASTPEPDPQISGAYRLQVIDSAASPHADDSRTNGATGLGTGWIGLSVDAQGQPNGFYWQAGKKPDLPTQVAVGRLTG